MHRLLRSLAPSRRGPRLGPLHAALAAFAVAACLALLARAADAAASLTVSENPVVIPAGETDRTVTLTWNTGSAERGMLQRSVDGGLEALVGNVGSFGSMPVTIGYGHTYLFKLYRTGPEFSPVASLTVTSKRPGGSNLPGPVGTAGNGGIGPATPPPVRTPAPSNGPGLPPLGTGGSGGIGHATPPPAERVPVSPPPLDRAPTPTPTPPPTGCALDCIKDVTIEQRGTKVHVMFDTTVPVKAHLWAFCQVEYWSHCSPPHPIDVHFSGMAQHFEGTYAVGNPGVVYDWKVEVTDAQNQQRSEEGSFSVFDYVVSVVFDWINIVNDSDSSGTGECFFDFWVNGNKLPGGWVNEDCDDGVGIYPISIGVELRNPHYSHVDLAVNGADDDTSFPFGLDNCFVAGHSFECSDTAGAQTTRTLSYEPGPHQFQMDADEGRDFAYQAHGVITIRYEFVPAP
jgi:hypothetical protein